MEVGALDRRITIEQRTDSQNAFGENVPSWSPLETVWANVAHGAQTEGFNVRSQEFAEDSTVFTIRYLSTVDVTQRITYGGNTYRIAGVRELDRHRWTEITAIAEVA